MELGLGELVVLVPELGQIWQVVEQSVFTMYAKSAPTGFAGDSSYSSSHILTTNAHEPMLASCAKFGLSGSSFDNILINFRKPTLSSGVCLQEYVESHQSIADVTTQSNAQMQHARVRIVVDN